jgi:hypothetical protein
MPDVDPEQSQQGPRLRMAADTFTQTLGRSGSGRRVMAEGSIKRDNNQSGRQRTRPRGLEPQEYSPCSFAGFEIHDG